MYPFIDSLDMEQRRGFKLSQTRQKQLEEHRKHLHDTATKYHMMISSVQPGQWIGIEHDGICRLLQRPFEVCQKDERFVRRGKNMVTFMSSDLHSILVTLNNDIPVESTVYPLIQSVINSDIVVKKSNLSRIIWDALSSMNRVFVV